MCLGIPGKIIATAERDGLPMGTVDFGGVTREVCLAPVPEAGIGDYAIVHVGFAISLLDEEEARATLEALRELGEIEAELTGTADREPGGAQGQ
jgi:hydrogenase expression/formation protein HypC